MQAIKRIKKLWQLTKKDSKALEMLEKLTPEQIEKIPEPGDGKAVFFGPPSEEDFREQELEDNGLKPWYERIRNL